MPITGPMGAGDTELARFQDTVVTVNRKKYPILAGELLVLRRLLQYEATPQVVGQETLPPTIWDRRVRDSMAEKNLIELRQVRINGVIVSETLLYAVVTDHGRAVWDFWRKNSQAQKPPSK